MPEFSLPTAPYVGDTPDVVTAYVSPTYGPDYVIPVSRFPPVLADVWGFFPYRGHAGIDYFHTADRPYDRQAATSTPEYSVWARLTDEFWGMPPECRAALGFVSLPTSAQRMAWTHPDATTWAALRMGEWFAESIDENNRNTHPTAPTVYTCGPCHKAIPRRLDGTYDATPIYAGPYDVGASYGVACPDCVPSLKTCSQPHSALCRYTVSGVHTACGMVADVTTSQFYAARYAPSRGSFVDGEVPPGLSVCTWCMDAMCSAGEMSRCVICRLYGDDTSEWAHVQNRGDACPGCISDSCEYDDDEGAYYMQGDQPQEIAPYHSGRANWFQLIDSPWVRARRLPREAYTPTGKVRSGALPTYGLRFGVELEVEASGNLRPLVKQVKRSMPRLLASVEHDGSLENGFELVTHAAGLDVQREDWGKADLAGLRSHNTTTCGLHVHFTRRAVSELTIGKIVDFFGNDRNADFLERMARRSFNNYAESCLKAQWAGKTGSTDRRRGSASRYDAVNVTNRDTIEIRLGKGTTRRETLIAWVEFVHAVIAFCEHDSPIGYAKSEYVKGEGYSLGLTHERLGRFILSDGMLADTRFLRAYMVRKRLLAPEVSRLPRPRPNLPPMPIVDVDDAGAVRSGPHRGAVVV